jgi:hypothetical protein
MIIVINLIIFIIILFYIQFLPSFLKFEEI